MCSCVVEEGKALTVDPCTNRWYIASTVESPLPELEVGHKRPGIAGIAVRCLVDSVPFTQSKRERKKHA
jgi:hypothetical protein